MNKLLIRFAIVVTAMVLAMVPATVDIRDASVSLATAVCQNEDCMPADEWTCGGRDDKCNLKYKACRDLAEEEEEEEEGSGSGAN